MQQQYAITVSWNQYIRNASFDADGYITLVQLLDGALPTESNRYQTHCILSVLDGPNTGLYSNSGTVQSPTWANIIISPVIRVSRVVTTAEILDLFTTPIELAPAPGASKYIVPSQCFIKYVNGGVGFTQPGNTNIVMGANNIFQFGTFLFSTSATRIYFPNNSAALTENTSLQLLNTIGNPSVGNGSFEVVLYYQIATSSL